MAHVDRHTDGHTTPETGKPQPRQLGNTTVVIRILFRVVLVVHGLYAVSLVSFGSTCTYIPPCAINQ
jgi:hypothetical protein